MTSERVQRQINRLLDEAEQSLARRDWQKVKEFAGDVIALDPSNADAQAFLAAAERALASSAASVGAQHAAPLQPTASALPASFAGGRYQVKKFLGEGGKKRVYLAHDTTLDRDVAFALIKTELWTLSPAPASHGRPRPWAVWATTLTSCKYSPWATRLPWHQEASHTWSCP
ncbi:MAG: hypothetical protein EXR53_05130 [Dehalococcoidia bacterium]|nr:hypothetical protein [Dehalococcoidia bacterium]